MSRNFQNSFERTEAKTRSKKISMNNVTKHGRDLPELSFFCRWMTNWDPRRMQAFVLLEICHRVILVYFLVNS